MTSLSDKTLLMRDLVERVEISTNWLFSMIRESKAAWSESCSYTQMEQLVTEWETKVIGAAVHEAEDLIYRASPLSG